MVATPLRLARAGLQEIYAQSQAEYPAECCGILTAPGPRAQSQVHPCVNIQDRLHEQEPEEYPRSARIAYFIDPQEQFGIIAQAERAGGLVTGFYHSHIDVEAYFSQEDKERAMFWDEPAYPEAVYLVVSVRQGTVRGYKCFAWDAEKRDYLEVEMELTD